MLRVALDLAPAPGDATAAHDRGLASLRHACVKLVGGVREARRCGATNTEVGCWREELNNCGWLGGDFARPARGELGLLECEHMAAALGLAETAPDSNAACIQPATRRSQARQHAARGQYEMCTPLPAALAARSAFASSAFSAMRSACATQRTRGSTLTGWARALAREAGRPHLERLLRLLLRLLRKLRAPPAALQLAVHRRELRPRRGALVLPQRRRLLRLRQLALELCHVRAMPLSRLHQGAAQPIPLVQQPPQRHSRSRRRRHARRIVFLRAPPPSFTAPPSSSPTRRRHGPAARLRTRTARGTRAHTRCLCRPRRCWLRRPLPHLRLLIRVATLRHVAILGLLAPQGTARASRRRRPKLGSARPTAPGDPAASVIAIHLRWAGAAYGGNIVRAAAARRIGHASPGSTACLFSDDLAIYRVKPALGTRLLQVRAQRRDPGALPRHGLLRLLELMPHRGGRLALRRGRRAQRGDGALQLQGAGCRERKLAAQLLSVLLSRLQLLGPLVVAILRLFRQVLSRLQLRNLLRGEFQVKLQASLRREREGRHLLQA